MFLLGNNSKSVYILQHLDQILLLLLPLFATPHPASMAPVYTSVGVPRVDFQLVQPVIVDSIQDKSLKIDRSYLASCKEVQSHPQIHQQQQGPLLSCMRWFHETMRTAMSSIDELHLEYSPAITGANTCPYINLISKQPCPALLQLCRVCALLSRCSPYAFWPS